MKRALAVVVVAYFGADDLDQCLTCLGTTYPIVVIDNSSDAVVADTAGRLGAAYVDAQANRGFAAGVNLGLARVPSDTDVLILNPDAVVTVEQVDRLHVALHEDPRLAVVSPALVDPVGGPNEPRGRFRVPVGMWREAFGLAATNGNSSDFVVGAVMLIKREALDDIGGFDESFFLYAEETDWQRRAKQRGWRSQIVPEVTAIHEGAAASEDLHRRELLFHAGTETYIRKWFGSSGWASYRIAALSGALIRSAFATGPRRGAARERAVLFWRGPRRAAGIR